MAKNRKQRPKGEPIKAGYVTPEPGHCSPERVTQSLEAFIDAFIQPARRERARLMLLEKPKRREEGLRELHFWVDDRWCKWLEGQETFAQVLAKKHNNPTGIFLTPDDAVTMNLEEAVSEGTHGSEDALFLADPGKLAFWFCHDHGMIRCQRSA